jgi:hypothetical protein
MPLGLAKAMHPMSEWLHVLVTASGFHGALREPGALWGSRS